MSTKEALIESLIAITKDRPGFNSTFEMFAKHLLDYGSASPDNLECIESLKLTERDGYFGLGLKSGELVSGVLHSAEGCDIPLQVIESYPNLTQEQRDAVLRVSTIILTSFEK